MKQWSFADAEYAVKRKRTRREKFLQDMDRAVPWKVLADLIEPHYPKAGRGRHPYPLEMMLRIHFMQQWFSLSDPAMEEALYDMASMRGFAGLSLSSTSVPDETTILNFRHLLERNGLAAEILQAVNQWLSEQNLLVRQGTIVDATLIDAPSSTKNKAGARDPEMHQTKKGNQWFFGMKAHIGVDVHSGLVHTVAGTAANVSDVSQAHALLHGQEEMVLCDAGYRGVEKRPENVARQVSWHVAMRRGERRALKGRLGRMKERMEKTKVSLRARVEHPFRVIKRQFGYVKVSYRGLAKNTAQLTTLFALSNLWMVRKELMKMTPEVRP